MVVLLVAAMAVTAVLPGVAIGGELSPGCRAQVLVPYAQPLESMRPIRRLPTSGKLPFGPEALRIRLAHSPVVVGAERIGFALQTQGGDSALPLDWKAIMRLSRVRPSGAIAGVLREKRVHVGRAPRELGPASELLTFGVGGSPAFYRVDITLLERSGDALGSYAEYFRILRPRNTATLEIDQRELHVGDRLTYRVANRGTSSVNYGLEYALYQFEEGLWRLDPSTPRGFPSLGISIGGGVAGDCESLRLAQSLSPGHYRLGKHVSFPDGKKKQIFSDFHVAP